MRIQAPQASEGLTGWDIVMLVSLLIFVVCGLAFYRSMTRREITITPALEFIPGPPCAAVRAIANRTFEGGQYSPRAIDRALADCLVEHMEVEP